MKNSIFFLLIISFINVQAQSTPEYDVLKQNSKKADAELQALINAKKNISINSSTKTQRTKVWKEALWFGAAGFIAYQGINLKNDGKVVLGKDLIYAGGIIYATHLTYMLTKKVKHIEPVNPYTPNFPITPVKPITTPNLVVSNILFIDQNKNDRIDANEQCSLTFVLKNNGQGTAKNVKVLVKNNSTITGLSFNRIIYLNEVYPGSELNIKIPIDGLMELTSGIANLTISFQEDLGFPPDEFEISINTKEFITPNIQIVDHSFLSDNGILRLGFPIQLAVIVQNIGQGNAEDVMILFKQPLTNVYLNGPDYFKIGSLKPNEKKELIFDFIPNKLYTEKSIPIDVKIIEKYNKYGDSKVLTATVDQQASRTPINIVSIATDKVVEIQIASLTSDVDKNIPYNAPTLPNRYAIVIGNEDYASRQLGLNSEVNVAYAINDAKIFKEYAINTLGVEPKNCFLLLNATAGEMSQKIALLTQLLTKLGPEGELIFYFAGHGFPDEMTKSSYLMPVDVSATNLNSAIKLSDLYVNFSKTNANRITFFLDACFTGAGRVEGLLASRGVKIKPKLESFGGNMISFTATTEEQTALPYTEKQHGMFTYFLLKKLQETKGNVTYADLQKYISYNVSLQSLKTNQKAQDPILFASPIIEPVYRSWKLK